MTQIENHSLNPETFNQVVEEARAKAANNLPWLRAVNKAVAMFDRRPLIAWDGHDLLILSPDSFNIYRANGECRIESFGRFTVPCPAYRKNRICYHRAMARLVSNYFEAIEGSTAELKEAA